MHRDSLATLSTLSTNYYLCILLNYIVNEQSLCAYLFKNLLQYFKKSDKLPVLKMYIVACIINTFCYYPSRLPVRQYNFKLLRNVLFLS